MTQLTAQNIKVGDKLPELTRKMRAQQIISAAAATRDWQPIHHDFKFATEKSGLRNIILNAPSQAGWISRYITDWTGPAARIKKLGFKMKDSICPGDELAVNGEVTAIEDGGDCGSWISVEVILTVGENFKTKAEVTVAVPTTADGPLPWRCSNEQWLSA